jgi:5'-methylthioinosine phosphorylase
VSELSGSPRLAVIGGTGMNDWPGLIVNERRVVDTVYGAPSAELVFGRYAGQPVIFLARHGAGHRLPPHRINYRANIQALADVGVTHVIAIAAVGAIAADFAPGEVGLPDDVIDYTYGREHTYSDGAEAPLLHVEFTEPFDAGLRTQLLRAAADTGTPLRGGGVLAVTQGPRLESAAEVRRLARDGCHMVGMTTLPEAALARERGLAYAALAVSVNWAAGLGSGDIHAEIDASVAQGMARVRDLLSALLPLMS